MNDDRAFDKRIGTTNQPEATQAQRRKLLTEIRGAHTYFDLATDGNSEGDNSAPTVTGSASSMPFAAPQWCLDAAALPKEEPLGIDVNEVPDCGGIGGRNVAEEQRDAEA